MNDILDVSTAPGMIRSGKQLPFQLFLWEYPSRALLHTAEATK